MPHVQDVETTVGKYDFPAPGFEPRHNGFHLREVFNFFISHRRVLSTFTTEYFCFQFIRAISPIAAMDHSDSEQMKFYHCPTGFATLPPPYFPHKRVDTLSAYVIFEKRVTGWK
jgi:hypothetical protein